jgi:molybdate transport system ATP-binding protein
VSFLEAGMTIERPRLQVDVYLAAERGNTLAVVGPNGAGKSTLVQALSGLLALSGGRVTVGDAVWEDVRSQIRITPQRRSVGVMFQDLALFPNMSAAENVAYGLRSARENRSQARASALTILEELGAADLSTTPVGKLSGGQAQKVALARALAVQPAVLLLDEPTSKLDVSSQLEVRRSLADVLSTFAGVALVVTHQPLEAMALAHEVLVIEEGHITQRGSPAELQLRPRSAYVAEFVGVNLLRGRSERGRVLLAGGATVAVSDAPTGDVFVAIHPTTIALYRTPPEGTPRNVWRLRVTDIDFENERTRVRLTGQLTLVAEVTRAAAMELHLEDKGEVWASTKATQVRAYPR